MFEGSFNLAFRNNNPVLISNLNGIRKIYKIDPTLAGTGDIAIEISPEYRRNLEITCYEEDQYDDTKKKYYRLERESDGQGRKPDSSFYLIITDWDNGYITVNFEIIEEYASCIVDPSLFDNDGIPINILRNEFITIQNYDGEEVLDWTDAVLGRNPNV